MNTKLELSKPQRGLQPQTLDDHLKLADLLAKSSLVPAAFAGKPQDVLVAVQMGAEVGLAPMQALQNIAVIQGRPSLWGDAVLAVCQAHKDYEYCNETLHRGEGDGENYAKCVVKRKGADPHEATFSVTDAKRAGLWGRKGPWTQYPQRMLAMRARSWALRNTFADALRGLSVAEEVQDIPNYAQETKKATESYEARFASTAPIDAVYEDGGADD